jgi:hypothetical protein
LQCNCEQLFSIIAPQTTLLLLLCIPGWLMLQQPHQLSSMPLLCTSRCASASPAAPAPAACLLLPAAAQLHPQLQQQQQQLCLCTTRSIKAAKTAVAV